MKQKDIALVIIAVAFSAVVSLFISKTLFAPPKDRQQQVDVVQAITSDFPPPDSRYFNSNANDPTAPITIGQNNNSNPFNGTSTQ